MNKVSPVNLMADSQVPLSHTHHPRIFLGRWPQEIHRSPGKRRSERHPLTLLAIDRDHSVIRRVPDTNKVSSCRLKRPKAYVDTPDGLVPECRNMPLSLDSDSPDDPIDLPVAPANQFPRAADPPQVISLLK